jgi:hypothetical protein
MLLANGRVLVAGGYTLTGITATTFTDSIDTFASAGPDATRRVIRVVTSGDGVRASLS